MQFIREAIDEIDKIVLKGKQEEYEGIYTIPDNIIPSYHGDNVFVTYFIEFQAMTGGFLSNEASKVTKVL